MCLRWATLLKQEDLSQIQWEQQGLYPTLSNPHSLSNSSRMLETTHRKSQLRIDVSWGFQMFLPALHNFWELCLFLFPLANLSVRFLKSGQNWQMHPDGKTVNNWSFSPEILSLLQNLVHPVFHIFCIFHFKYLQKYNVCNLCGFLNCCSEIRGAAPPTIVFPKS